MRRPSDAFGRPKTFAFRSLSGDNDATFRVRNPKDKTRFSGALDTFPLREHTHWVRVIAQRTLRAFWEKHPQAEQPLRISRGSSAVVRARVKS